MEFVLLWIFFAVVTAIVASNKGRSVAGWAIAGLFFGILATIIVALLRPLGEPRRA